MIFKICFERFFFSKKIFSENNLKTGITYLQVIGIINKRKILKNCCLWTVNIDAILFIKMDQTFFSQTDLSGTANDKHNMNIMSSHELADLSDATKKILSEYKTLHLEQRQPK